MSGASDGLLDHLIFHVALAGDKGQNAGDFIRTVANYHADDVVDEEDAPPEAHEDLFLSVKPPKKQIVLNSDYLESLWVWVSSHNDINLTTDKAPTNLQLPEHAQNQQAFLVRNGSTRLTTTEDRIWHAIADHGKDWLRIPKSEFHCLCVIAAHGIGGVLQPDVVQITGQDKRSVPTRTDKLAQKGYITKEPVMGGGSRTSLLRLKKFSNTRDPSLPSTTASRYAPHRSSDNTASIISYDQWFDAIIKTLRENNNEVAAETIRKAAGVTTVRTNVRAIWRCLKRIERSGLIRTVLGLVDRTIRGKGKTSADKVVRREVRSVKLLRDPTPADRDAFIADLKRNSAYMQPGRKQKTEFDDDEEDEEDADDSDLEVEAGTNAEANVSLGDDDNLDVHDNQEVKAEDNGIPSWTPDVHFSNLLYDLVDSFGVKGVSSMELAKALSTTLWRKPFDDTLGRLTDVWQISQPPHLRHLAIVRDTDLSGSSTHYTFRTILNYQIAVQNGNASWDYLTSDAALQNAIENEPTLDKFGFHCIPEKDLFNSNLPAAACAKSACDPTGLRNITAEARDTMSSLKAAMLSEKVAARTAETPVSGSRAHGRRQRSSISLDKTPSTQILEKRKVWTKRYHEVVAAWDARIMKRAKDAVVAEELRKLPVTPPEPVRKRGRPKKVDQGAVPSGLQSTLSVHNNTSESNPENASANASTRATGESGTQEATQEGAEAENPSTKRSRKRKRAPTFEELNIATERLQRVADDLKSMQRPGVYINHPLITMIHRDENTTQGRPRNGLLATFKSNKLKSLAWMSTNHSVGPSIRLQAWVPELFGLATDALPDSGDELLETPSQKSKKKSKPANNETNPHDATISQGPHQDPATSKVMGPPPPKRQRLKPQSEAAKVQTGNLETIQKPMTDPDVVMYDTPAPALVAVPPRLSEVPDSTMSPQATGVPDQVAADKMHSTRSKTTAHAGIGHTKAKVPNGPGSDAHARTIREDSQRVRMGTSPPHTFRTPDESVIGQIHSPGNANDVDRVNQDEGRKTSGGRATTTGAPPQVAPVVTTSAEDDATQGASRTMLDGNAVVESPSRGALENQQDTPASTGLNMWQTVKSANFPAKVQTHVARKGVNRNSGQMEYQRAKIVLDIIRQCGGVFPGRRELFLPFATAWYERFKQLPDRKTLERSLRGLQLAGRIKRIPYSFEAVENDTTGVHTSYLLAEPHIDPAAQIIKDTIGHISKCYPQSYIPPHVHVADKISYRIRQRKQQPENSSKYPPLPAYFLKDASAVLQPSKAPRLGRLEEELKASAEARARKRLLESQILDERPTVSRLRPRGEQKEREGVKSHQEDGLPPEVQEHTTEFQLSNYQYQPGEAHLDRGPKGLARLSKRLHFTSGVQEQVPGLSAPNLRQKRPRQQPRRFSRDNGTQIEESNRVTVDPIFINEGPQTYDTTYDTDTLLDLNNPETSFHVITGTFSTQPARQVNVRTHFWADPSRQSAQVVPPQRPVPGSVNHIKLNKYPPAQPQESVHFGVLDFDVRPRTQASTLAAPAPYPAPRAEQSQPPKVRRVRQRKPDFASHTWRRTLQATPGQQGNASLLPQPRSVKQLTGDRLKQTEPTAPMTAKEEERLLYAVAVVTTLLGGLQQTTRCTNYAAVNHAMHFKFDGAYCRQHYGLIKPKHGPFVERLQQRFRVLFLHAFERDEIPAHLDLSVVENTDWSALVDWAQARLRKDTSEALELPDTREDFDLEFEIEPTIKYEPNKDDFFGQYTSTVRREEVIRSYAYFDPLPDAQDLEARGPSMLLQSWIRANVLTPEDTYDPAAANAKLKTFGNDPLQKALDSMLGQQLIKGSTTKKSLPGRAYVIGLPLGSVYNLPWQFIPELFSGAAAFKAELDTAFDRSKDEEERFFELPEGVSNAQTLVVLNLHAHGLVDITVDLPPTDPGFDMPPPKMTKWGFMKDSYKSRGTDITHLSFPMTLRPTARYVVSSHTAGDDKATTTTPPDGEDRVALCSLIKPGQVMLRPLAVLPVPLSVRYPDDERTPSLDHAPHRTPIWTDIHGALIKSQLRQLVMLVLFLLLGRPGVHVRDLSRILGGRVWEWELEVLCEWLGRIGVLEREDEGRWGLAAWWWLALEAVEAQEGEEGDGAVRKRSGPGRAA